MKRREAVGAMAMAALTAAFKWTPAEAARAANLAQEAITAKTPFAPAFFTPHEWETVRVLADLVIPKDERSGSATDAGVPEYMDFMMTDRPDGQTPMRGGLACQCRRPLSFSRGPSKRGCESCSSHGT